MTVAEIAEKLGAALLGDGSVDITGLAGLGEASCGDISFLANPKYASSVSTTKASAVIVPEDWEGEASCSLIKVSNPDAAFARVALMICPEADDYVSGVHPSAVVDESAELGEGVSIGPLCVIEKGAKIADGTILIAGCYIGRDVSIGSDCKFYPNVSVRERCVIGNRVILHNGAVIGSDGFGNYIENGKWQKIPQVGIVEIGDDVEIGANTTVDRARFGKTVIKDNVRLDNLVQIAHNVVVGESTAMAAQTGISGSTTIGKHVLFGGQSAATGHLKVADNTVVAGRSVVTKDTKKGAYLYGYPAMPHKKAAKIRAHMMHIGELNDRVKALEKKIKELEEQKG